MSKHGEGHSKAYDRLVNMKSLEEILNTAISFERTARDFYSGLVSKVRKPLRELVQELADEEADHLAQFEAVRDHADTQSHLRDMIEAPVHDHKFSNYIQLPELGDNPDDQALLQYAMGREQAAYEQYSELSKSTPDGELKDLFAFLADEELRHKGDLEKRYYEIIHSGGV